MARTENGVLDRLLADADPARTPRDAAPDARALAERDRIMSSAHRGPRPARVVGWTTGLIAVAASAALAFTVFTPQSAATAETPSPLDFSGESSLAEVVTAAENLLAGTTGGSEPERVVRTAYWSFAVEVGSGEAEVVPELATFEWAEDLSGEAVSIAGEPYDPTDASANTNAEVESTGEVIARTTYAAGEFASPVVATPGDSPADVRALLVAFGLPEAPTAFDVVAATSAAFGVWTLSDAQHAEILSLLEEYPGAQAVGASTDRLGRPVDGIRVVSADGVARDDLLVSRDTGRIVGVERTLAKDDGYAPAGAVVDYRMWDLDEETLE